MSRQTAVLFIYLFIMLMKDDKLFNNETRGLATCTMTVEKNKAQQLETLDTR
jgi:hypothetical protein